MLYTQDIRRKTSAEQNCVGDSAGEVSVINLGIRLCVNFLPRDAFT